MKRALWVIPLIAVTAGTLLVLWRLASKGQAEVRQPQDATAKPPQPPAVPPRPPAPAPKDKLLPGGGIRVIVKHKGTFVEGANVDVRSHTDHKIKTFTTNAGGTQTILNMPTDEYRIGVRHPKYLPQAAEIITQPGKTFDVEFELKQGGQIDGVVVDPGGTPLPDTTALLQDAAAEGPIDVQFQVKTDKDGRYVLSGVPAGDFKVRFRHDRFRAQLVPVSLPNLGDKREVNATLRAGSKLTGRILDEEGAPIEEATVTATNEETVAVSTDKEGRFTIDGLGDEPVYCFASARGFGPVHRRALPPNTVNLEIRLPKGARIAGRITVVGGTMPHQFTVNLYRFEGEGQEYRYRSRGFGYEPGGIFGFDELPPSTYRIEIEAQGYQVLDAPRFELKSGQVQKDLQIRLKKAG